MARWCDWLPCLGWAEPFSVEPGPPVNVVLAMPGARNDPSDANEPFRVAVIEPAQSIVTERVIGQVDIFCVEGMAGGQLVERIRVGMLDDEFNFAGWSEDFSDAGEANEPFLWQRVSRVLTDGTSNIDDFLLHPWWSVIDVKVSRRLDRMMALVYSAQIVNSGPEVGQVVITPFLRTYACGGSSNA